MGRGNVCVTGQYEGLFYIDNDDYHVYVRDDYSDASEFERRLQRDLTYDELTCGEWYLDEYSTSDELDDILDSFANDFTTMFPSFELCGNGSNVSLKSGKYGSRDRIAMLENKLFYVAIEDNEWSLAIELICKEEPYGMNWMENLQKHKHQMYLEGMAKCLLSRLPSVGTRSGAWTSGRIKREEVIACER